MKKAIKIVIVVLVFTLAGILLNNAWGIEFPSLGVSVVYKLFYMVEGAAIVMIAIS